MSSTLNQRIQSIITKNLQKQQSQSIDIISQSQHPQQQKHKPITQCVDKLLNLIVKLQQSKVKKRNQLPIEIRNKIFVGNYVYAGDQQFLIKNNVGLVLSCLDVAPTKILPNMHYQKIPIKDRESENLLLHSDKIFTLIETHISQQPESSIFIHCFHGKSRSVAVLVMYLMRKQGRGFDEVYDQIKGKYNVAKVNGWFVGQLREYEKTLDLSKGSENQSTKKMIQNTDLLSQHSNLFNGSDNPSTDLLGITFPSPPLPQPHKKQQYHLIQIQEDDDTNQNIVQDAELI